MTFGTLGLTFVIVRWVPASCVGYLRFVHHNLRSGKPPEGEPDGARVTHSIRINDQWRVCFVWREGAERVEIVDYH